MLYIAGMPKAPTVVLTIAGFDPSSGAGITADVKTMAAHGCYGICCITALTVQSTAGVCRVEPVSPDLIRETLNELHGDLDIAAVKIGMLGSGKAARAVAEYLANSKPPHVVLDPVLKASSGTALIDAAGLKVITDRLLPLAEVVTPNLDEASALTGLSVADPEQMKEAASKLHATGVPNVVVTGGHLEEAIDVLSFSTSRGFQQQLFKAHRQRSSSTHGTGCAFSTAIACHLALGRGLPEAVLLAKAYVTAAISKGQPIGRGTGPVHHLYRMHQEQRRAGAVSEPESVN